MRERARLLRKNQTPAEVLLWNILRNKRFHGFKFRRQHEISNYIVDFVCLRQKIIVETDGDYHKFQKGYDVVRDELLAGGGYKVLRFSNQEVLQETEKVLKIIYENLIK